MTVVVYVLFHCAEALTVLLYNGAEVRQSGLWLINSLNEYVCYKNWLERTKYSKPRGGGGGGANKTTAKNS